MSDGRRLPWRLRADLARGAGRERLRAAGLGDDDPERRARGGVLLVLWAWAVFVLAGAVVRDMVASMMVVMVVATAVWWVARAAGPSRPR
jgi:hypothetical protein